MSGLSVSEKAAAVDLRPSSAELGEDPVQVEAHRPVRDVEFLADFAVG